ncbi:alpha/beta hydrolase fold domain-containing protein [Nonomuraea angiospora]|uniref:Acetyl esterase/lipase n=1 Tax=Nonomuraea angiospora TaxID=46172 RepID=A0ABR9LNP3_9ACTN|nr:alpha/beta hydrolase [Nonomuraea angiospora]MBE1582060.1 acetyl esterase/lipase [Nonomuraea angiospora]
MTIQSTAADFLAAGEPVQGSEVEVERLVDLAYAPPQPEDGRGHLLDLYVPAGGGPYPLAIWTSGSAFRSDEGKQGAAEVAAFLNPAGYAVAGVSVRASGQAVFPAQVHDVKAAVRWLRANATRHRLDADRFAVMGNSSGGWVATMAALTGDVPELEGEVGVVGPSSRVQAAVDLYGPTDFLQMDAHMPPGAREEFNALLGLSDCHDDPRSPESLLMGGPIRERREAVTLANPVTHVTAGMPPLLIVHGRADRLVPEHQSVLLFEAVAARNGTALFYSIPELGHEHSFLTDPARAEGHVTMWTRAGQRGLLPQAPPPTWETVERFVRAALGSHAARDDEAATA